MKLSQAKTVSLSLSHCMHQPSYAKGMFNQYGQYPGMPGSPGGPGGPGFGLVSQQGTVPGPSATSP